MRDFQARVVRKQRAYDGKLLKIDRELVEFPDGKRSELETIRHPGAAAVLPFLDDERVVLIRQYRHAVSGVIVEVPAGKLDIAGEAPEICAQREVREETGYLCHRIVPLGSILTTPGFTNEVIWLYEGHDLEPGPAAPEEHEWIETFDLPLAEAEAMVRRGEITDGKSVACILQAVLRRRP